jgi:methylmalonyl-CoA mutase cobalamin-binding subunit
LGSVVAAIFWTWLWGPVGLVLAVPLTVCLVVAGQHVPQLRFFTILFSDRSTLSFPERLYQRLLAKDYREAERLTVVCAANNGLDELFGQVLIPALELAERDRHNGVLSESSAEFILETAKDLIDAAVETIRNRDGRPAPAAPGSTVRVFCIPAADEADEIAAMMLAELLRMHGISADLGSVDSLASEHADRISDSKPDVVAISILPPIQRRNGRYLLKRLRANHPSLPIVIGVWRSADIPGPFEQFSKDRATSTVGTLSNAVSQIRAILSQRMCLAANGVSSE